MTKKQGGSGGAAGPPREGPGWQNPWGSLITKGLPDEILEQLNGYSIPEIRAWLAEQPDNALSLEGRSKSDWVRWLAKMERKIAEHEALQEASESSSQTSNEEPEVAGGLETGYNMV